MSNQTKDGTPTTCHACQRHATGIGIGDGKDPRYLCPKCLGLIAQIKRVDRFDLYELEALDGGVNAVGDYIESIGFKTNLADFTEIEQRMLCKAVLQGFGDELRRLIEVGETPF